MKVHKKIYWLSYKWRKINLDWYHYVFVFVEEYPPLYVANSEAKDEEWCIISFGVVEDENRDYAMLCIKENFGELIRTEKENGNEKEKDE